MTVVVHESERCNYSHTVVIGRVGEAEMRAQDLPKLVRKNLRSQLFRAVVSEIPVDLAGTFLDEGSWI